MPDALLDGLLALYLFAFGDEPESCALCFGPELLLDDGCGGTFFAALPFAYRLGALDAVTFCKRESPLAEHLASQKDHAHLIAERQLVAQFLLAGESVQDAADDALAETALDDCARSE